MHFSLIVKILGLLLMLFSAIGNLPPIIVSLFYNDGMMTPFVESFFERVRGPSSSVVRNVRAELGRIREQLGRLQRPEFCVRKNSNRDSDGDRPISSRTRSPRVKGFKDRRSSALQTEPARGSFTSGARAPLVKNRTSLVGC